MIKFGYWLVIAVLCATSIAGFIGYMPLQGYVLDRTGYDIEGSTTDGTSDVEDENLDESDDTTSSVYPALSNVKHDDTWWEERYVKDGYRFVFNSDNRAGPATISWLKKVQAQADDKMDNTKRDENIVFNDYVRSAAKQKGVIMSEEYESDREYPNGRDFALFVDDNNGDTKVLEVDNEDTEFDLGDLKDPDEVFSTPEEVVPASEVKSLWQQAQELINASKAQPVVETPVVQTPVVQTPVVQTPVVQTPVVQTPVVQTPVVQTPVVQTPVVQTPVVQNDAALANNMLGNEGSNDAATANEML